MGSSQSKSEAAYDYTRMNYLMGTDGNISNSIPYKDYMVIYLFFICLYP